MIYNKFIKKLNKNIIIQFNINCKCFNEDYAKFLKSLNTNELLEEVKLSDTDKLKKNGTFRRGLYYCVEIIIDHTPTQIIHHTIIKIQKLQLTTTVNGFEEKIYISVFPFFVNKYNKFSLDVIEHIGKSCRKGEYILNVINDKHCILDSEDPLQRACEKIDKACQFKEYASCLNANHTKIHEVSINTSNLIVEIDLYRYPNTFELLKIASNFFNTKTSALSKVNRRFNFLK